MQAKEVKRQRQERQKGMPDLGPGRSVKYHQQMNWGNQTLLNPEPKIKEIPFAAMKRAFDRDNKRTASYANCALDGSHLPQTPIGGISQIKPKPLNETHARVNADWMDDTQGQRIVHDVGKYPFPNKSTARRRIGTGNSAMGSATPRGTTSRPRSDAALKSSAARTPR